MPNSQSQSASLISPQTLSGLIEGGAGDLLIADCSFDLANPEQGYQLHQQARIPGAIYIHLDRDLCGKKTGRNGRHPLPDKHQFVERLRQLGISNTTRIVAYDNAGGPYAARLWWLLRWVGHDNAALLDGGVASWREAGFDVCHGNDELPIPSGTFSPSPSLVRTASFTEVLDNIANPRALVLDARSPDRFRGENETIDPVGGHIPGAVNRFFRDNLDEKTGRFKTLEQLHTEFSAILGNWESSQVIHQCGSGVTGCHNLFAFEIAGFGGGLLYPGSWSEWIAQADVPIEKN